MIRRFEKGNQPVKSKNFKVSPSAADQRGVRFGDDARGSLHARARAEMPAGSAGSGRSGRRNAG